MPASRCPATEQKYTYSPAGRFTTTSALSPPMEKEGFNEIGSPVHTTPMTASTAASSTPMPYTVLMAVVASSSDTTPDLGMYPWFAKALSPVRQCQYLPSVSRIGRLIVRPLTRTRSTLLTLLRRLESMVSCHIDWAVQ